MAKILTISDTRVYAIKFARDDSNNISYDAEYQWVDENGDIIPGINLQVDSQRDIPLASFPTDVRNAMITLNTYARTRINTLEGIS